MGKSPAAKVHPDLEDEGQDSFPKVSLLKVYQFSDPIDKCLILIGALHSMAAGGGLPGMMVLFGEAMDALAADGENFQKAVNKTCVWMIYVGLIIFYCVFVATLCWTRVGDCQARRIKEMYIRSVLGQDIGWFDQNKVTELPTKIVTATRQIQDGVGKKVGDVVQYSFQFLGSYVVGFYFSWKISLVIMAGFPVITGATLFMQKTIQDYNAVQTKSYATAGAIATEVLGSVRTVFSLNGQDYENKRYNKLLGPVERAGVIAWIKIGLSNGAVYGSMYLIYALGYWYGGYLRSNQLKDGCLEDNSCISGGNIVTVFFAILMGSFGVSQAGPGVQALTQALQSAGMVFATIDRTPAIDVLSSEGRQLTNVEGKISVSGVKFSYPTRPDNIVYQGLTLEISPGENVALVGPSGEGKSTLISLVLRFYDPQDGQVMLDNVNIKDLNVDWYRNQIGYVGQEPVLFAGSLRKNIRHGKPSASDAEVENVAKAANAHDSFIMKFPKGYDTDVGEAGTQLSGGQKQRIAIARALIKQPKILLLDEATSALDNESERVVQQALDDIQKGAQFTTIVVAHRLTTIQNCDKIAVISGGKVAELGSHSELLKNPDGIYSSLANPSKKQAEEETKEDSLTLASVEADSVTPITPTSPKTLESSLKKSPSEAEGLDKEEKGEVADGAKGEEDIEEGKKAGNKVGMMRLFEVGREKWGFLAFGCIGCVVMGAAFPAQGLLIAKAQDMYYTIDPDELYREACIWSLGFVIFGAVIFVASVLRSYGLGIYCEKVTANIREMCFKKFLTHSIPWFDSEDHASGALVERLATDASKINVLSGGVLASSLNCFFSLVSGIVMAFYFSWQMSLGVLATIPMMMISSVVQMKAFEGRETEGADKKKEIDGRTGATVSAAVQGIRTVQAFGMQHTVLEEYKQALALEDQKDQKKMVVVGAALGYANCAEFLIYAFAFWLGGWLIENGHTNFEDMLTALFCLACVAFGMADGAQLAGDQKAGQVAAGHVFALLDSQEDIERKNGDTASEVKGDINFNNIKFAYPQRPDVLVYDNFNLSVASGTTVALCGPSGGGKSTCMQLLLQFYSPLEGNITFDGKDIRDLSVKWLRSQIGYVSQEPVLFSGSIRSNIAYGMRNVSEQAMMDAAKVAKAHDFVMEFQNKYDTDVGEKSMLLSGGQKQRLAIARAILRNPKVLLLDEATSALDNENEKLVQQALDDLQAQRKKTGAFTTLVIAHRLSTIQNADCIVVVQAGTVVELGTHDELLNKDGVYKKLVTAADRHE